MVGPGFPVFRTRPNVSRHLQLWHLFAQEALDVSKAPLIFFIYECYSRSRPVGTRGAANAMHVVFHIGRHVVVDDEADAFDVDASR